MDPELWKDDDPVPDFFEIWDEDAYLEFIETFTEALRNRLQAFAPRPAHKQQGY